MVTQLPLPTQTEIRRNWSASILVNRGSGSVNVYLTEQDKELLCKAALGLTVQEAEGTFARAMVSDGILDASDIDYVLAHKQQILKKSGALEYVTPDFKLEDVGGLENLKQWLSRRYENYVNVFTWDPIADEQVSNILNSPLFASVSKRIGLSTNDLFEEAKRRAEVLHWMRQQKIRSYKEVAKIIAEYYARPKEFYQKIQSSEEEKPFAATPKI